MNYNLDKKPCGETIISSTISEYTFAPLTCASLINEIMVNFLFQKSQIPYPYSRLRDAVNNRSPEGTETRNKNFLVLKSHYNTASEANRALEEIMDSVNNMFRRFGNKIKKIVVVLGSTPYLAKEVFTIDISNIENFHHEKNHFQENKKKLRKTLRNLFFSETWMNLISTPLPCTNTYIFLSIGNAGSTKSDWSETVFIPSKQFSYSEKVKHTIVKIDCNKEESFDCCEHFKIFEDVNETGVLCEDENKSSLVWLESKTIVKGFKDCFINKVSVSDIW